MPLFINYPDWLKPEILPGILPIRWYGLMYIVAFALTFLLFKVQLKERTIEVHKDLLSGFFTWAIVGVIVGARLIGTTVYDTEGIYRANPWMIVWPFNTHGEFVGLAGMSFHGGVLGGIVALVIYTRLKKISLLTWGDMLVTAIPLGYTFGRLGNFINGELFGRVTTAPWGMVFPTAPSFPEKEAWVREAMNQTGALASGGMVNLPRHPSQLYEAFGEGILLFLVFWFIFRKRIPWPGFMIGLYIMGYGLVRFIVEYFRMPDKGLDLPLMFDPNSVVMDSTGRNLVSSSIWNFSTGQILCFLMILGGGIFIAITYFKERDRKLKEAAAAKPHKKHGKN